MTQLILHHHDPSPFAEKIRLIFGIKDLAWHSVQIPMIMPKPDLTALTGGYRKTPVVQIGADIYCDSALIARELEQRFPKSSLFPNGNSGLAFALGRWSDTAFFEPGAGLSMGENKQIPEDVLNDRKNFFNFMDFDRLDESMPHAYAQFQANCQLLEDELASRPGTFLLGESAAWVDILAYFPVWMAQSNIPRASELLEPFAEINRWSQAMAQIGHGQRSELASTDALGIARNAAPEDGAAVEASAFHDFEPGDPVTVTADDYGCDPVTGTLKGLNRYNIVIGRESEQLGATALHFPRTGFLLQRR